MIHFFPLGNIGEIILVSSLILWWEWILGCWIAEQMFEKNYFSLLKHFGWIFAALSIAIDLVFSYNFDSSLRDLIWPLLMGLFLYSVFTIPVDLSKRWSRGALAVGHASYSLYLIHPVMLHVALFLTSLWLGGLWLAIFLSLLFTFAATFLFYRWVEYPFMKMSQVKN